MNSTSWFKGFLKPKRKMSGPVHVSHTRSMAISSAVHSPPQQPAIPVPPLRHDMVPIAIQVDDDGLKQQSSASPSSMVLTISFGSGATCAVLDLVEVVGFIGWFAAFMLILFLGVLL